ncbi:hypothetical protein BDV24DRAFT_145560 [Aspergillus arachidicola]|uniref:MYND-type domain-containing protein n=1 Tax=Aspergillus arachidicola TaxID=656916 RepID=A0A5N6XSW6_9EURO|nr:hypothetical protein BDV24DRAFT_145560 [Aspergillus arachidicola]
MIADSLFPCAEPSCNKDSRYSCSNCKLVSYCGKSCQVSHWPEHKRICKSTLIKHDWRPCWEREKRTPAFASPQLAKNHHNPFGKGNYLWGNVPAIDVLNLVQNEGDNLSRDVAILFAGRLNIFHPIVGKLRLTIFSIW